MVRWLGILALGALLAKPAAAGTPWQTGCSGQGAERRCTVTTTRAYPNNRGGKSEVTLVIVRDATCTTLHVTFDGPIAVNRPVRLALDGGPPQHFYTADQLGQLTRALDAMSTGPDAPDVPRRTERTPPEFTRFLKQVSHGDLKDTTPEDEMVARFAALKEPRRIGLACAPTLRLLPRLSLARMLRLDFSAEPRNRTSVYHWTRLTDRTVELDLEGLSAALDRISAER